MFLNIKTDHNFLQSLCKVDELICFAKEKEIHELGIVDDIFFIDTNKFILECKKNNIKPIVGVKKKILNFLGFLHVTIYAKNQKGILKINNLPKIIESIEDIILEEVVLVFDINEIKSQNKAQDQNIKINKIKEEFEKLNIENYYFSYDEKLLLEDTNSYVLENMIYNEKICFLKDDEVDSYLVLRSIAKKNTYLEQKPLKDKYKNYSFEMKIKKLKKIDDRILKNTRSFIDNIKTYTFENDYKKVLAFEEFKNIDFNKLLLTKLENYLANLENKENLKLKNLKKDKYFARLNIEIDVIKKMEFQNYFLIMKDIVDYLKQNDIKYGYGRGSAAGSLISYLLDITKIDPIEYDLYFERFLNIKRASLPDIDLDISDVHRQEVITFLINKYGSKNVAKIFTLNKYLVKSAFADVAKSLELDKNLIKKISSNLTSSQTFEENIMNNYKFFGKYEGDVKFNFLKEVMENIEGLAKNISIHAAGVVISNIDLTSVAHIEDNTIYSQAKPLEEAGFIKFDLLGLSTLSFIDRLEKKVKKIDPGYDEKNIPLNYAPVFRALENAKTLGIFQLESEGIRKVLKKYKPKNILDIAIVISLYRPGPMENIDKIVYNKEHVSSIKYVPPILEEVLSQTYGIMVFQEQIMEIVKTIAGFTNIQADVFRVAISKKKINVMNDNRNLFITGGQKKGYNLYTLEKLYDSILKFANYGFNKAHAVSYARLIYQVMYIKTKYPTIFFDELFSTSINSKDQEKFLLELEISNIKILPPSVKHLTLKNTLQRGVIVLGLGAIRGISKNKIDKLIAWAKKNQNVDNYTLIDFLEIVIDVMDLSDDEKLSLIGSGIFDEFLKNRKTIYLTLKKYTKVDINILKLTKEKIKFQESEDFSFIQNSQIEKQSLGFNLNYSPKEYLYKKLQKKYKGAKLIDIALGALDLEINKNYFVLGSVTRVKEIINKNNEEMAFIKVKINIKEIDVTIFPKEYEKLKEDINKKIEQNIIFMISKSRQDTFILKDIVI